jgi:hypothetical protein
MVDMGRNDDISGLQTPACCISLYTVRPKTENSGVDLLHNIRTDIHPNAGAGVLIARKLVSSQDHKLKNKSKC